MKLRSFGGSLWGSDPVLGLDIFVRFVIFVFLRVVRLFKLIFMHEEIKVLFGGALGHTGTGNAKSDKLIFTP